MVNQDFVKPEERDRYSDLKVMKSAAGWYIGTTHTDGKTGFTEPGTRDSDYFNTEHKAIILLAYIEGSGDTTALRPHP